MAVQPDMLARMRPYQKINHFPGMYSLARKNHLGKNLMKMMKQFPDDYDFFPQTWLLPAESSDFRNQFSNNLPSGQQSNNEKGKAKKTFKTYIVKPEAGC